MNKLFYRPVLLGITFLQVIFFTGCKNGSGEDKYLDLSAHERQRVLDLADSYLESPVITVTADTAERSAGGIHDFYSEGDYWWPDPENPEGPYIRRDGETNPDNFVAHRQSLRRMSIIVPALVAAYQITGSKKYAEAALQHLNGWFVDKKTMMNPSLLYAQAIKGRVTGRGIGIIDTLHLVEVALAIQRLQESGFLSDSSFSQLANWFESYLEWITTHPYGIEERDHGNNHSTSWALQVAAFASMLQDSTTLAFSRDFYRETLVPEQLSPEGTFPKELARTKPYGYMLFHMDVMVGLVQLLSTPGHDLWHYETQDGRTIGKLMEFMEPYIRDKSSWPYPPDVMYYEEWPVRHPALLFAGRALDRPQYIDLWKKLESDPQEDEVVRNFPIRQPVLWY